LACRACNLHKSDHIDGFDPISQQNARLFHPREDEWREHFMVQESPPSQFAGKTPSGRATIERLRMNSPLQLTARTQWITLGLFP
jgi:hypothetical protein